jgi:hypothetical protein
MQLQLKPPDTLVRHKLAVAHDSCFPACIEELRHEAFADAQSHRRRGLIW